MAKRATTIFLVALGAAVVLAVGSSIASALPSAPKVKTVTIAMKDPGCHWFRVGTAYKTHLAVKGATSFLNTDEAALVFKGAGSVKKLAVGKTLTVSKPGTYHITMVGQAPDDNHLVLVVK